MRATGGWFYCGGVSDGACGTVACCFLRVVFFFLREAGASYLPAGTAMRRPVRGIPGGLLSLIKAIL